MKCAVFVYGKKLLKLCSHTCYRRFQRRNTTLSIVFYGSDSFSTESLKALHGNYIETDVFEPKVVRSLTVVTGSDQNDVSKYAKENQIPLKIWPHNFEANEYDLGVVASFGKLIPLQCIQNCRHGMLNVHASLLPRWRGASPIGHAILNGDKESGVTIMRIKPHKFDVGECIMQTPVLLQPRITAKQLHKILALLGAKLLLKCIKNLDFYLNNAKEQSSEGITYSKKFKKEDGRIVWHVMTADEVDRRFRALDGFIDVFTRWIDGTKLRLLDIVDPKICDEARIDELLCSDYEYVANEVKPGFAFYHKKRKLLFVKCADNRWIAFRSVWPCGRKQVTAAIFYGNYMKRVDRGTVILDGCEKIEYVEKGEKLNTVT